MSSFSSASQMRDPLPRTMNLGWPPTAPNARTGELTPPGIRAAARFCRRCDCSTLRDVVGSIRSLPYTRKRKRERKAYRWQLAMPAINITADLQALENQWYRCTVDFGLGARGNRTCSGYPGHRGKMQIVVWFTQIHQKFIVRP